MRLKKFILIPSVLIAMLFSGCYAMSVHPLYTEKDLIVDPMLEGTFKEKGSHERWLFKKGEDQTYRLFTFDEESSAEFEAHLLTIGSHQFLDIFPAEPDEDINGNMLFCTIPVHLFAKCVVREDSLYLGFLSMSWLEKNMSMVDEEDIAYFMRDDSELVFTAPTEELQRFISEIADNEEAFSMDSLIRVKDVE